MESGNRIFGLTDPNARFELLSLPDCVHLDPSGRCRLLERAVCSSEGCSFSCSERERSASVAGWKKRMCALDLTTQNQLSARYYCGAKPWLEGDNKED